MIMNRRTFFPLIIFTLIITGLAASGARGQTDASSPSVETGGSGILLQMSPRLAVLVKNTSGEMISNLPVSAPQLPGG